MEEKGIESLCIIFMDEDEQLVAEHSHFISFQRTQHLDPGYRNAVRWEGRCWELRVSSWSMWMPSHQALLESIPLQEDFFQDPFSSESLSERGEMLLLMQFVFMLEETHTVLKACFRPKERGRIEILLGASKGNRVVVTWASRACRRSSGRRADRWTWRNACRTASASFR